jgi:hypothetical protein
MIKPLRTVHFWVWRVIAIMLPLLFLLALIFRPAIIREVEATENFHPVISITTDSLQQVIVEVSRPLHVPSCLVYGIAKDSSLLLGRVSSSGKYFFTAPDSLQSIYLYDNIHHKKITQQNLAHH